MVNCVVVNCTGRSDKNGNHGRRFFNIPKVITGQCDLTRRRSERRRALWISRINRKDLQEADIKPHTKVCSAHFIKGAPSALFDENNPDWAPSQNLGYSSSTFPRVTSFARYQRTQQRAAKKRLTKPFIQLPRKSAVVCNFVKEPAVASVEQPCKDNLENVGEEGASEAQCENLDQNPGETEVPSADVDSQGAVFKLEELQKQHSDISEKYSSVCKTVKILRDHITNLEVDKLELETSLKMAKKGAAVLLEQMKRMEEELRRKTEMLENKTKLCEEVQRKKNEEYMKEVEELRQEVMGARVKTFTDFNTFINDEVKVRFYTGLPSSAEFGDLLNSVVSYFKEQSIDISRYVLEPWQCLLMTLMKLRLALMHQDLAYRFGVSKATAIRVFELLTTRNAGAPIDKILSVCCSPVKKYPVV